MAILGTILATIFAIPLSFLGARNLTPNIIVFSFARFIFNSFRGISEMVFALIFVSAVGMGPFPGVLALTVTFTGFLAKFFSEAIEGVDPGPIEALQAAGANKIQTIMYAIMPQVVPLFVAFILYIFEVSIRSATIVGLVGAGGIGFALVASMKLFEYKNTGAIMVVILVLVTLIDYASTRVRARIY
jgi:phosphonate transport system permease protein